MHGDWDLTWENAVKYICRAGKTSKSTTTEDLSKARWYISNMLECEDPSQQFTAVEDIEAEYTITYLDNIVANWKLNDTLRCVLLWIHQYVTGGEYTAGCCLNETLRYLDKAIAESK